jgi:hypothetical protein
MERKGKAFEFLGPPTPKKGKNTHYIICNSLNEGNATTFLYCKTSE